MWILREIYRATEAARQGAKRPWLTGKVSRMPAINFSAFGGLRQARIRWRGLERIRLAMKAGNTVGYGAGRTEMPAEYQTIAFSDHYPLMTLITC